MCNFCRFLESLLRVSCFVATVGCVKSDCWGVDVVVSSTGLLVSECDAGDSLPTLSMQVRDGKWLHDTEFSLVATDGGFTLPKSETLVEPRAREELDPDHYLITFDLLNTCEADTAADNYSAITIPATSGRVELWNGWILELSWGEPWYVCK